jgi:hypothetical protein
MSGIVGGVDSGTGTIHEKRCKSLWPVDRKAVARHMQ